MNWSRGAQPAPRVAFLGIGTTHFRHGTPGRERASLPRLRWPAAKHQSQAGRPALPRLATSADVPSPSDHCSPNGRVRSDATRLSRDTRWPTRRSSFAEPRGRSRGEVRRVCGSNGPVDRAHIPKLPRTLVPSFDLTFQMNPPIPVRFQPQKPTLVAHFQQFVPIAERVLR